MTEFISKRFHVIIDACKSDPQKIADKAIVEKALRDLVDLCEMKILHGPVVSEGVPENPGLTGFVTIDYSHISIHTFTKTNEICVDVFSCKAFDVDKVRAYVKETFGLSEDHTKTINVNHGGE